MEQFSFAVVSECLFGLSLWRNTGGRGSCSQSRLLTPAIPFIAKDVDSRWDELHHSFKLFLFFSMITEAESIHWLNHNTGIFTGVIRIDGTLSLHPFG